MCVQNEMIYIDENIILLIYTYFINSIDTNTIFGMFKSELLKILLDNITI